MNQFDELPEGWTEVRLEEVAEKVGSGATPRGGSKSYQQSGVPLIRSMNVHFNGLREEGLVYLDDKQAEGLKNVEVKPNDVLLNITGASIGRVTQAPFNLNGARVNQHVCIIRPTDNFDPAFLTKYLASPKVQKIITAEEYGMTRQALTKQMILDFEVPLPPLNEQRRIVEKIEALTARSRKARAALDEIPALLDQFRQSVLAAAFRGDLTADWRAQNPDVEPAEALLERIRAERRDRWEAAQLENMKAKGKEPKDSKWKEKYKEPDFNQEVFDLKSEFEVENNDWAFAHLELLVEPDRGIPYGIVQTGLETVDGIPTVRCGDIKNFKIGIENLKKVDPKISKDYRKTLLKGHEILIAIRGTVGAVAIVTPEMKGMNISREVAMVPLLSGLERKYVMYLLSSPIGSSILSRHIKGVAQSGINLNDLRSLPVPIPSEAEQKEIVNRIEMLLSISNQHEEMICGSFSELDQLDQSILAKAFRGELVPQDPSDEPAALLLDRIRAEREQLGSSKKRGKTKA